MFRKKIKKEAYDRATQKPVIRASICTGEQVAGFKDVHTGKFTEIMLIKDQNDKQIFMEKYDILPEEIAKEW